MMLAAGGLIALVAMGFLLDGFIGQNTEAEDEDETGANEAGDTGDSADAAAAATGDFVEAAAQSMEDVADAPVPDDADRGGPAPLATALFGTDADDSLSGGEGDDTLAGGDGHDVLDGNGGADVLDGGAGADVLRLGAGDTGTGGDDPDWFEVHETTSIENGEAMACVTDFQPGIDRLFLEFECAPDDAPTISVDTDAVPGSTLVMANGVAVTMLEGIVGVLDTDIEVVALGPAADAGDGPGDSIAGDGGDDTLSGGDGDDTLDGYAGDDLLDGGTGDDLIRGRAGMDSLFGASGEDAITGGVGNDQLDGGSQNDALFGNEGDDLIDGQDGNDEIYGDEDDDTLNGGAGADLIDGGIGNDSIDGGDGGDLLFGGDGDDALSGGARADYLQGGFGADTLDGGDGDDRIDGTFSAGDAQFGPHDEDQGDVISGGAGDDMIFAGAGDMVSAGDGADTIATGGYIAPEDAAATLVDFDPAEDVIEVLFDPDLTPNPVVTVQDFADGTGADILLDGHVVLKATGAQGLSPDMVDLRAIAFDDMAEA